MREEIKKHERQPAIEMLRIIAMFLVLIIHANAFGIKWQTLDLRTSFGSCMTTVFLQTISCVCVNVFVLISGWFGIHFSIKGLCKFLFQCVFFLFGIYIFMLLACKARLSIEGISGCLLFLKWNWFIKTYIMLYIISPILNYFIENAQKTEYMRILMLFFVFQTIYGWLTNGAPFFEYGQSLTSFVGLYLLAQYVRRYKFATIENVCGGGKIFFGVVGVNIGLFVLGILSVSFHIDFITGKIFAYTSPIVIINALGLLISFVLLNPYFTNSHLNKIINKVGASSFAVFLLHTNPNLFQNYYQKFFVDLYNSKVWYDFVIISLAIMLVIYVVAVLVDQLRILLWNKFQNAILS